MALMLDDWFTPYPEPSVPTGAGLFAGLERAAAAIARLDQALEDHPLLPAFLHRARLDAVRRQAAVDGHAIDPWHLAALLEGLRLRMDTALSIAERGQIFEAARTALTLHQWITEPDFDQEGEVQVALRHLTGAADISLVGVADAVWSWLRNGGSRVPIRAALTRLWTQRGLLRVPVPLTGPGALSAEAPPSRAAWVVGFLEALAREAEGFRETLRALEHEWIAARARAKGQRGTSRAALAVDVLAAAPLLSATTLAGAIGMSVKGATDLLDRFASDEIVVEVTHRSGRRLFGLSGLVPLRAAVRPPYRPDPTRGRGQPMRERIDETGDLTPAPLPPISPVERREFDYTALEEAVAHMDVVVRRARHQLTTAVAPGAGSGWIRITSLGSKN
jgi:hypothetical protein